MWNYTFWVLYRGDLWEMRDIKIMNNLFDNQSIISRTRFTNKSRENENKITTLQSHERRNGRKPWQPIFIVFCRLRYADNYETFYWTEAWKPTKEETYKNKISFGNYEFFMSSENSILTSISNVSQWPMPQPCKRATTKYYINR